MSDFTLSGHAGELRATSWDVSDPRYLVILVHGYGEHIDRYGHVAAALNADGAAVYAVDHLGHGRSEGERVVFDDVDKVVDDVHLLAERARAEHPDVPVVLVGHSMGGLIGSRYLQRYADELACGVLSGPLLSAEGLIDPLLALEEIPDTPLDPATLSRDPAVGAAYAADPLIWHGPFKRPMLEALKAGTDAVRAGGRFAVPVYWVHGEDDQIVPIEGTRTVWEQVKSEGADETSYPGARHEIFNETNQGDVLSDVVGFVNRHV